MMLYARGSPRGIAFEFLSFLFSESDSYLFNALDPLKLQTVLMRLVEGFSDQLGDVIAIDGKALRRPYDRARKKSAPHLVQAFAPHARLILGQVAVGFYP